MFLSGIFKRGLGGEAELVKRNELVFISKITLVWSAPGFLVVNFHDEDSSLVCKNQKAKIWIDGLC